MRGMNIGFGVQDMPLSCLLFMSFMLNVCATALMYSSSNYLHIVAFIFLFFSTTRRTQGRPSLSYKMQAVDSLYSRHSPVCTAVSEIVRRCSSIRTDFRPPRNLNIRDTSERSGGLGMLEPVGTQLPAVIEYHRSNGAPISWQKSLILRKSTRPSVETRHCGLSSLSFHGFTAVEDWKNYEI